MLRFIKNQDTLAIVLLIVLAGLFYAFTFNRSTYSYILRADEGLSFATAVRVTQGFIPQHDFPSYYGPVMPYVYGIPFKIFGPSIILMRGEWALLYIVSIVLFYRIGRHVLPPFAAFAAAAMMIGQQHTPLYTYNHVGFSLATECLLLLLMGSMAKKSMLRFRVEMIALLLLALLIKFNEAFVVFLIILAALWIADRWLDREAAGETATANLRPTLRMVAWPGAAAFGLFLLITAALNFGLTKSQFLRNFPLLPQYQASIGGFQYVKFVLAFPFRTGWQKMSARGWYFFWYENYVFAILLSFAVAALILFCAVRFFASGKYRRRFQQEGWKAILLLGVAVGTYHEFYLTGNHWSTPMYVGFGLVAMVYLIWSSLEEFQRTRIAIVSALLLVCFTSGLYYIRIMYQNYSEFQIEARRAMIYSSAQSDAPTVAAAADFLEHATPPEQPMAAFPHDALLIYLAGRTNAMRDDDYQWMLFPTPESDLEIANELAAKKVPRLVVSNFVGIRHGKPVFFGRDYLPQTFKYILNHYTLVKTFGNNPRNYQVQYLERIETPSPVSDGSGK